MLCVLCWFDFGVDLVWLSVIDYLCFFIELCMWVFDLCW